MSSYSIPPKSRDFQDTSEHFFKNVTYEAPGLIKLTDGSLYSVKISSPYAPDLSKKDLEKITLKIVDLLNQSSQTGNFNYKDLSNTKITHENIYTDQTDVLSDTRGVNFDAESNNISQIAGSEYSITLEKNDNPPDAPKSFLESARSEFNQTKDKIWNFAKSLVQSDRTELFKPVETKEKRSLIEFAKDILNKAIEVFKSLEKVFAPAEKNKIVLRELKDFTVEESTSPSIETARSENLETVKDQEIPKELNAKATVLDDVIKPRRRAKGQKEFDKKSFSEELKQSQTVFTNLKRSESIKVRQQFLEKYEQTSIPTRKLNKIDKVFDEAEYQKILKQINEIVSETEDLFINEVDIKNFIPSNKIEALKKLKDEIIENKENINKNRDLISKYEDLLVKIDQLIS